MSRRCLAALIALAAAAGSAFAVVVPQDRSRFDALVIQDPASRLGVAAEAVERVPSFDGPRAGWDAFRAANGRSWSVWIDRRSGAPLLAQGAGIRWIGSGQMASASVLEAKARQLVAANEAAFLVRSSELVLNPEGTGSTDPDHWVVVFDRAIGGIPVEGESFVLYINQGRLVSFGAGRWGATPSSWRTTLDRDGALAALRAYMSLRPDETVETVEPGALRWIAMPSAEGSASLYQGAPGAGVDHRLVWRFALRMDGERGTWVGKVDAETGKVLAFFDDDQYAQVKGGIYPISNDQDCANFGCELPSYPAPYVSVTIGPKKTVNTGDYGLFDCQKGSKNSSATLNGPYVKVTDTCGIATVNGSCVGDLDFGVSGGTDCTSAVGSGDTHSGRSTYYLLNRLKEKARYWLPGNSWAAGSLNSRVNQNNTCNAFYNGNVNFYKSGGGCRNTGEIGAVVSHEYGHGLDANDGGGSENPGEAYGDAIAILQDRGSCVGRGFFQSGTCSGYGDSCLSCSGVRDMDWDQRVRHTPATPANFTAPNCGGGGGPCGREVHCEAYPAGEAIYDLATRDLPAAGLDAETSWQTAEKLFYKSRQGSGGNAFNCALPSSDGCGASAWFTKLRTADDDDGDLSNGTPHAAAIYAAFARHAIACGTAADPSNLNSGNCAALAAPTVTVTPGSGSVTVSWSPVSGAARYLILRNDVDCRFNSNVIATVDAPATSFVDDLLPSGFPLYYRVQAQGSNVACDGAVSSCTTGSAN